MTEPAVVRYIKLGRRGEWEHDCINGDYARFGTSSADPIKFHLASSGRFEELRGSFLADGVSGATATRFANDTRAFFTTRDAIWITFANRRLYWARFLSVGPTVHPDGDSTIRPTEGAWDSADLRGQPLWMEGLAGFLTKSAAYRGTTFTLPANAREYVLRRIAGRVSPEVAQAQSDIHAVEESVGKLVKLLEPKDFELLVDLVFTSTGGWRRLSDRGSTQKTVDMIVEMPSTQERAWIQVKSTATPEILANVMASGEALKYDRAFFVHHSGTAGPSPDPRLIVIGPRELSARIVDAGLIRWLIDKVT